VTTPQAYGGEESTAGGTINSATYIIY